MRSSATSKSQCPSRMPRGRCREYLRVVGVAFHPTLSVDPIGVPPASRPRPAHHTVATILTFSIAAPSEFAQSLRYCNLPHSSQLLAVASRHGRSHLALLPYLIALNASVCSDATLGFAEPCHLPSIWWHSS